MKTMAYDIWKTQSPDDEVLDEFKIDEELEKDFLNYLEEKEKENEII